MRPICVTRPNPTQPMGQPNPWTTLRPIVEYIAPQAAFSSCTGSIEVCDKPRSSSASADSALYQFHASCWLTFNLSLSYRLIIFRPPRMPAGELSPTRRWRSGGVSTASCGHGLGHLSISAVNRHALTRHAWRAAARDIPFGTRAVATGDPAPAPPYRRHWQNLGHLLPPDIFPTYQ